MEDFFKNWNYRKHAKLCIGLYGALFLLDMTLGYMVAKRLIGSGEASD